MVNNKQIAKNALYLYIRTFFIIILSLYSSRIILKALGVEDFGLYNLIGSIVALFTSLRVVFASATQRYFNYERAKQDIQILRNIFLISKRLHLILSVIFFLIAELLGYWLLENKLNIPPDKLFDAYIVLHCSVGSAIATLLTVPFDAVIISNEKFNAYAYLAILESALQLGAAFAVFLFPKDRLIYYSIIILIVAILVRIINWYYCKSTFLECQGRGRFEISLFRDMGKFAGWNFLGNFSLSLYNEGINMVLNIFGGVIANAARGISAQVIKGISSVSDRMISAFSPQATIEFAKGEKERFFTLIILSTKIINFMYICLAVPIFIFTPLVLKIWLGAIPEYAIEFVRAILIYGLARSIHSPLDLCFKCLGDLKKYQIIEISLLLPSLPIAYILLKYRCPLYFALLAMAISNFINDVAIIILAKYQMQFPVKRFIREAIFPIIIVIAGIGAISIIVMNSLENTLLQICFVGLSLFAVIFLLGLTKKEKNKIQTLISRR